jgi:phage FluMu gp28-like protein
VDVEGTMMAFTRWIDVLEKKPFRFQKMFIKERLTRHVVKCNIDMGGIGYQLAEELTEEYPRQVEGVALGGTRQGQMALTTKSYFESQRIQIPSDPTLRLDLQQVSEAETAAGGVPVIKTDHSNKDGVRHGDRFWAMSLAIMGLPVDQGPRYHRAPRGVRSKYAVNIR